jgi:3',5'-nucleoside bisphosphate phosphatase
VPGYDMHTHTTASDGTTEVEDNVAIAVALGLDGLAITDHDTVAAWERGFTAAGSDLDIVPGAEMSAELDGFSVHVLGYWFDPDHPELAVELERLRTERDRRAEETVERLVALGIAITIERVREIAAGAPIGRPHIASAVVEAGAAVDVREVFDRWLHDGGPAYVPKYAVDPASCVRLVVEAGGAAVLAHPGLYGGPETPAIGARTVEAMVAAGLAGIEADHPDHDDAQRDTYRDLARVLGLVVTGGSDFHGDRKQLDLGAVTTPREAVEELRARAPSAAKWSGRTGRGR